MVSLTCKALGGGGTRYAPATVTAGVEGTASCTLPADLLSAAAGSGVTADAQVEAGAYTDRLFGSN
jgi:hypothetical protein